LFARTIQLKLRTSDFHTITRAHTPPRATQLDNEIFSEIRDLFRRNWKPGSKIRLLGVHASSFDSEEGQIDLLNPDGQERWSKALAAADKLRDRFGEAVVSLASGMKGRYRERVHENPAGLPGKNPKEKP
jgi:DNA polymerase-4